MFSTSTQKKFWIYSGTSEVQRLREDAHNRYVSTAKPQNPLSIEDENVIRRHYEYVLLEFCKIFQPTMPKSVVGTAMAFYKRFFLHASVMNHDPKNVYLACAYLACKVDEFNLSLGQFTENLKSDGRNLQVLGEMLTWYEPVIMQQLRFHLYVHNPYRPVEGLLVDIKTRCPQLGDLESLRPGIEDFLERSLCTDILLIFSPSQLALAAILSSASRKSVNLDNYVMEKVVNEADQDGLLLLTEQIKRIRYMVKEITPVDPLSVKSVLPKLEQCKNYLHEPGSSIFKANQERLLEQQDQKKMDRRKKYQQEEEEFRMQCMASSYKS